MGPTILVGTWSTSPYSRCHTWICINHLLWLHIYSNNIKISIFIPNWRTFPPLKNCFITVKVIVDVMGENFQQLPKTNYNLVHCLYRSMSSILFLPLWCVVFAQCIHVFPSCLSTFLHTLFCSFVTLDTNGSWWMSNTIISLHKCKQTTHSLEPSMTNYLCKTC